MDVTRQLRIFRPIESDEVGDDEVLPVDACGHTSAPGPAAQKSAETPLKSKTDPTPAVQELSRLMLFTGALLIMLAGSGCTAFRPLKGVPVQSLPWDMRGISRANMETIDLSRLGQTPPPAHLIDSGDVLAIYVEGVLGRVEDVPPINLPQQADTNPTLGYPIPVREDGTISLPLIPTLTVRGLTIAQAEELVRRTYTVDKQQLERGQERILVSLQKARTHKITVLRQETTNAPLVSVAAGGAVQLGQSKKGMGQIVVLQAGENDVLHALTLTGGLPGLDAQNALYVIRRPRARPIATPGALGSTTPRASGDRLVSLESPARVIPVSFNTSKKKSPIQLVKWQGGAYGGRYDGSSQDGAAPAGQVWGHSAPQTDYTQPVQLEAPQLHDTPMDSAENVGFRQGYSQGYSQPMPIRPGLNSMPMPSPEASYDAGPAMPIPGPLPGAGAMPGPGAGPMEYPPEIQPYLTGGAHVVRIPIRLHPGEQALFTEPDIVLFDGDILFIESRETEIFYTGGLLGGGQYQLPRDYDLDVLDAISITQGRQASGGGGAGFGNRIGGIAAVNQDISVSASNLVIIRRLPEGGRMNIKVDLNRALRDQNENILIQPGDHLILRYKPMEAVGAFVERNLLAGSLFGLAAAQTTGGNR